MAAALLVQGISVAVGTTLGAALPTRAVGIAAGVAFLAVAAWTLRGDVDEPDEATTERGRGRGWLGVAAIVAAAFLFAELGGKTMLATVAVASQQSAIPTWLGSTAGEVAANLLTVVVGRQVGVRLSQGAIRIGSAALFAVAGAVLVVSAAIGDP